MMTLKSTFLCAFALGFCQYVTILEVDTLTPCIAVPRRPRLGTRKAAEVWTYRSGILSDGYGESEI